MKKFFSYLPILFVVLFYGCNNQNDVVKIGIIAPLTGPGSVTSEYWQEGYEMALQELNAIEDGMKYEIIYEDCQSDATQAVACYKRLELQGVKYVIAVGGQFAMAVAPLTKGKDMLYFTSADYNESVLEHTDCGFRVFPSATTIAEVSSRFLRDSCNISNIATITMNTVPCLMATERFVSDVTGKGAIISYQDSYDIGASDFKNTIAKMADKGIEAVFFNGFGLAPVAFCNQLSSNPQFDNLIVLGDVNFTTKSFIQGNKNDKLRVYYADSRLQGAPGEAYFEKHQFAPNSYVGCSYILPFIINEAITSVEDRNDFKAQRDYLRNRTITTPGGSITFDQAGSGVMDMEVYPLK
jgi:branched-chain amino acid transport system substrate-binding protein